MEGNARNELSEPEVFDAINSPQSFIPCPLCSISTMLSTPGENMTGAMIYSYVEMAVIRGCTIDFAKIVALKVWNNSRSNSLVDTLARKAIIEAHYKLHHGSNAVLFRSSMETFRANLRKLDEQMCVQTNAVGPIDLIYGAGNTNPPQIGFIDTFSKILTQIIKNMGSLIEMYERITKGMEIQPTLPFIGRIDISRDSYCFLCHGQDVRVNGTASQLDSYQKIMNGYNQIIDNTEMVDPAMIGISVLYICGNDILDSIPCVAGPVTSEMFCCMCSDHFSCHDRSIRAAVYHFRHVLSRASMVSAAIGNRDVLNIKDITASTAILTAINKIPTIDTRVPRNSVAIGLSFNVA